MSFVMFAAWAIAILAMARFAELAGVDGRVAFAVGGFFLGVLYTIHFTRRWASLHGTER